MLLSPPKTAPSFINIHYLIALVGLLITVATSAGSAHEVVMDMKDANPATSGATATSASFMTPTPSSTLNWNQQESVHLHYDLTGQAHRIPYSLPADIVWQVSSSRYKAKFEISHFLLGTRTQISEGDIIALTGISPSRFIDKTRSEDTVVFNRPDHQIEYSTQTTPDTLDPSAQDQLSVTFQLGFWIAKHLGQLPVGSRTPVQLVSKKNAERREFQFIGSETLNLPIGKVDAFKITRVPRSADDQRATIWLLKNRGLTLCRLLLEEQNGDFVDQKLARYELVSGLKLPE